MIRASQTNMIDSYDNLNTESGNQWLVAFRESLRGRVLIALLLGVLIGGGASAYFYLTIPPKFESNALIRVQSSSQTILRNTGDKAGNYDQYLGVQVELIKSRRVVDMAMRSADWVKTGGGLTPLEQQLFRTSMSVRKNPSSEVLQIFFRDVDPAVAKAGASALVEAYLDMNAEQQQSTNRGRLTILENRQLDLNTKLDSVRDQINTISGSLGRESIRRQYESDLAMRNTLRLSIQNLEDRIASASTKVEFPDGVAPEITEEMAAQYDVRIAEQIQQREQKRNQLRELVELRKHGSENKLVKGLRDEIAFISRRIDELRAAIDPEVFWGSRLSPGESVESLKTQLVSQKAVKSELEAGLEDLGDSIAKLSVLEREERLYETDLAETRGRIDTLNLEAAANKEVQLLNLEVSPTPVNGKKKLGTVSVAGVCGFAAGFLVIGGFGMMRGTVRSSRDVLLGLPDRDLIGLIPVVDSQIDAESVEQADMSIDHVRSMLQSGSLDSQMLSVAVTGPISGSGKTSISLLLGRSFAEAGYKTVLVDFDFVGQGLSSQFRRSLAPRIGDLLESAFEVPREQIEIAVNEGDPGKQLGGKLCEMGLVSEQQLNEAIELQTGGVDPLRRVIEGATISECVVKTRLKNLYALPLGQDDGGRIGQKAIQQLLDSAKDEFEVMVMDTGPTPGAVEGALAVSAVDRVLVVVARGDDRSDIDTCDHFLRSVQASVAGYVLNRAEKVDLKTSHVSLSISRRSQPGRAGGALDDLMVGKN